MKNNYFNRVSLFILSSLSLTAMEKNDIKQPQTIDDIPEFCVNIAKQLDAQLAQSCEGLSVTHYKMLPFNHEFNHDDASICTILYENEKIKYPANFWHMRIESDGYASQGIIHTHYPHKITPPPFTELQTRYYSFIQKLKHGWHFKKASDYPDIFHTQPEATHHLLIKEKDMLFYEDTLIRFLASKFKIRTLLACDTDLKSPATNAEFIYLWVKKEAWQQFQSIFKLEVDESKN